MGLQNTNVPQDVHGICMSRPCLANSLRVQSHSRGMCHRELMGTPNLKIVAFVLASLSTKVDSLRVRWSLRGSIAPRLCFL